MLPLWDAKVLLIELLSIVHHSAPKGCKSLCPLYMLMYMSQISQWQLIGIEIHLHSCIYLHFLAHYCSSQFIAHFYCSLLFLIAYSSLFIPRSLLLIIIPHSLMLIIPPNNSLLIFIPHSLLLIIN